MGWEWDHYGLEKTVRNLWGACVHELICGKGCWKGLCRAYVIDPTRPNSGGGGLFGGVVAVHATLRH